MLKVNRKQLKELVVAGFAKDITLFWTKEIDSLLEEEGCLNKIGYGTGVYGQNCALFQGSNTKTLYVIVDSTLAFYQLV